jgi:phosphoglycerate kinase
VAILGGAKVSDKIDVVEALLGVVDALCIGGAMANTFLAAQGKKMQKSRIEEDKLAARAHHAHQGSRSRRELVLPVDVVVAEGSTARRVRPSRRTRSPRGFMALDIGPKTVELIAKELERRRPRSGTGPWACSRRPRSPRAPSTSPRA